MRPHLTKLTITQHNFNPTVLWGGVAYILSLGLTLPDFSLNTIFLEPNEPNTFLIRNSLTKSFVDQKICLTKKNFFWTKFFGPLFYTQIFTKFFFDQKCFLTEYFVRFKKKNSSIIFSFTKLNSVLTLLKLT